MSTLRAGAVIATSTFLEGVRNRALLVGLVFAVALTGISVAAASVSLGGQTRIVVDVGLFFASALGTLMAVALGVTSFAAELRAHTAYPVLARPIPRWLFVAGKAAGLYGTMALVVTGMYAATLAVVWLYGAGVPAAFGWSYVLSQGELAIAVATAVLFSAFARPALAACYAGGLLLAGHLSQDLAAHAARLIHDEQPLGHALHFAHYVLPDLSLLSLRTQAANDLAVPQGFVALGLLYAAAYTLVALALAMLIFTRRRVL